MINAPPGLGVFPNIPNKSICRKLQTPIADYAFRIQNISGNKLIMM